MFSYIFLFLCIYCLHYWWTVNCVMSFHNYFFASDSTACAMASYALSRSVVSILCIAQTSIISLITYCASCASSCSSISTNNLFHPNLSNLSNLSNHQNVFHQNVFHQNQQLQQ